MTRTEKERLKLIQEELVIASQLADATSVLLAKYLRIQELTKRMEENQAKLKKYPPKEKESYSIREKVMVTKREVEKTLTRFYVIETKK